MLAIKVWCGDLHQQEALVLCMLSLSICIFYILELDDRSQFVHEGTGHAHSMHMIRTLS